MKGLLFLLLVLSSGFSFSSDWSVNGKCSLGYSEFVDGDFYYQLSIDKDGNVAMGVFDTAITEPKTMELGNVKPVSFKMGNQTVEWKIVNRNTAGFVFVPSSAEDLKKVSDVLKKEKFFQMTTVLTGYYINFSLDGFNESVEQLQNCQAMYAKN